MFPPDREPDVTLYTKTTKTPVSFWFKWDSPIIEFLYRYNHASWTKDTVSIGKMIDGVLHYSHGSNNMLTTFNEWDDEDEDDDVKAETVIAAYNEMIENMEDIIVGKV